MTRQQTERKDSTSLATILPYIPTFSRIAKNERSLLQRSVYLQAQLSSVEEETAQALSRLAHESHLLTSGPSNASAWGNTAADAEIATKEFVKGELEAGQQELSAIAAAVELCSLQSRVLASS